MRVLVFAAVLMTCVVGSSQQTEPEIILPSRPISTGQAPRMKAKRVAPDQWAIVFYKDDEVLSGLTDFAIAHHIHSAHFTGIGAVSRATLGWLDLDRKAYRAIQVPTQSEVGSLIGDVALFNGKPIVHMHAVLAGPDGKTVGGHVWELRVNPTVEVFLTDGTTLSKRPDDASGMKLIDP